MDSMNKMRMQSSRRPASGRRMVAGKRTQPDETKNCVRKLLKREISRAGNLAFNRTNLQEKFRNFHLQEEFDTHDPKAHHFLKLSFLKKRSRIVEIGAARDTLFALTDFGICAAFSRVLCPEQHNALNAFQWTLQRTPESLRTLHQPIHPRIIPIPPSHQVAQENHRQFPTSIGQADLKNCRKYQSHILQTHFAHHSSCNYIRGSGMRNQASPELRVLQERNMWGQSYALESSRISKFSGIREPRQGKRDNTQARPL